MSAEAILSTLELYKRTICMLNSKSLLNIKSLCVYYKTNDLKNSTIKLYLFSTPKKIIVFDEINSKLRHACSKTHEYMANRPTYRFKKNWCSTSKSDHGDKTLTMQRFKTTKWSL
jgi:hypothetical protein